MTREVMTREVMTRPDSAGRAPGRAARIRYEKYRLGRRVDSVSELYSHTKSLCSSVYGVAENQGFTSVFNTVGSADPNYGTRQCNPSAKFQNVLTMCVVAGPLGWVTWE